MKKIATEAGYMVGFKSEKRFYDLEVLGLKPNTFREVTEKEMEWLLGERAETIRITCAETGRRFYRTIMSVCRVGEMLGNPLIIISWET